MQELFVLKLSRSVSPVCTFGHCIFFYCMFGHNKSFFLLDTPVTMTLSLDLPPKECQFLCLPSDDLLLIPLAKPHSKLQVKTQFL